MLAKEPHIVDVANFLIQWGADIRGAGTDVIKINGVEKLHGNATYSVVPDQIEAENFYACSSCYKRRPNFKKLHYKTLGIYNSKNR